MSVAQKAFASLMSVAGRAPPDFVTIREEPAALKTRYYADEAAAAAMAAGAVMAADLWEQRTGQTQKVDIGTREAGAGLVSYHHQKFLEPEKAPPTRDAQLARAAAFGFHRAKDDRFVYLHPSFPPSTEKLVKLLGCEVNRDAIAAVTAKWNSMDLENAIAELGVCGAQCRSPEEWDVSEQGRVLASRPVVEVIKIGESDPEPFTSKGEAPLSGTRVLDLTRVLAGPTCARTLAAYGADVMMVTAEDLPSAPMFVADTGHGKLSAFVDLKTEAGREKMRALVRQSDVFGQGYRQGALERLGFGPLELAEMRPGIISVAINCYGHEGPWRPRPGWEQLAQTVTGMAYQHGGAESPTLQPGAVTDYTTGFLAAFGTLVALKRRALYGGSYLVRAALCQTGMWVRSLGYADESRLSEGAALSPEEIERYSIDSDTGFGRMRHLRPAMQLSRTPTRWRRGTRPLGSDVAAWPG